jgi:phenylacetic acid degradation protein
MSFYEFKGKIPKVGKTTWVHETAQLTGDVEVGEECFIGAGAVLRGDFGSIRVGDRSSIQECCVLHCRPGAGCTVGNDVTIGHGAVLHGCEIKDRTVIGMHGTVSDNAVVGKDCIVGEASLVRSKQQIPDGSLAVGNPAEVKGQLRDNQRIMKDAGAKAYVEAVKIYFTNSRKIPG